MLSTNGGTPKIKYQGAYAVFDLWTWGGWLESYVFFLVHDAMKNIIFGTAIAIGFAMFYGMSQDLPLCVKGDIKLEIPFMDYIDVCYELGLDKSTVIDRYGASEDASYTNGTSSYGHWTMNKEERNDIWKIKRTIEEKNRTS